MGAAGESEFLDLHRKNRQLERLLAGEQEQLGQIAKRLTAIETERGRSGPSDVPELRVQLTRIAETMRELRRGRSQ
ncbi:hypothetical protein [Streptomyces sp. NPDC000880]